MSKDLLTGLEHLHARGFTHRDLKPENVLCDSAGSVLKLGDLGLAREIRSRPPFTDYIATRWYRAPECCLRASVYGPPIDTWAIGCIVFELHTFRPLLPGASDLDMLHRMQALLGPLEQWSDGVQLAARAQLRINAAAAGGGGGGGGGRLRAAIAPSATAKAVALIEALVSWDPRKRPTCTAALAHPFCADEAADEDDATAPPPPSLPPQPAAAAAAAAAGYGEGDDAADGLDELLASVGEATAPPQPARPAKRGGRLDGPRWAANAGPSGAAAGGGGGAVGGGGGAGGGAAGAAAELASVDEARLRSLFDQFDADGSGAIDLVELRLMLAQLGRLHDDAAAAALLSRIDADGSSAVSWEELHGWWAKEAGGGGGGAAAGGGQAAGAAAAAAPPHAGAQPHRAALTKMFEFFDANKSGQMDLAELRPLLVDLGVVSPSGGEEEDPLDDLLAEMELLQIDADGSGQCSLEELLLWWQKTGRGAPPKRWSEAAATAAPEEEQKAPPAAATTVEAAAGDVTPPVKQATAAAAEKSAACVVL